MSRERTRAALQILTAADQALVDIRCEGSTDCCRFRVTGREPWLTRAEWELVVAEVRRQGRRLPALPEDDDGRCPFLNDASRCQVYSARPLGCRTYFCERAAPAPPRPATFREAARALAALSAPAGGRDDDGTRPLTHWLALESPRRRQNWK